MSIGKKLFLLLLCAMLIATADIFVVYEYMSLQRNANTLNKILAITFGINSIVFTLLFIQGKKFIQPINALSKKIILFGLIESSNKALLSGDEAKIISDSFDKMFSAIKDMEKFPNANPNPVFRISKTGAILFANTAARQLLQFPATEIPKLWQNLIANALHSSESMHIEEIIGAGTFSLTFVPVKEGSYVNIYGTNISEQKKKDQSLLEIIKVLDAIYHEAPIGIAMISFDSLKFILANDTLCYILYYPAGELKTKSLVEITHSEDIVKESNLLTTLQQKNGKTYKMEKRFLRKDGAVIWVSVSASSLFNSEGVADAFLYLVEDITERKHTDEVLLMKSRQAHIGEMISIIAHQWRQPLTAISAITSKMKNRIQLNILKPEDSIAALSAIQKHILFLSETIDDFRTFFLPDKLPECVTIDAIVEKILFIIGKSLEANRIALTVSIEYKKPLKTYQNELIQVFLNLLQNIIDITTIRKIDTPKAWIHVYKTDDVVVIEVSDNAGGISDDLAKNIFLPYFSTKGEKYGTGLGLYLCKLIIERHCKGTIEVKNAGNGALFTINLPVNTHE
ncbi:MAG: PAS domain S-box protein [Planctomycetes bacterium]|nr:PAS domain S-box protein [Planctomycetota bacterium]